MEAELNLDTFGEIMDEFLTKNECQMLITLPEGTLEATTESNMNAGPVLELYFLLQAMETVSRNAYAKMDGKIDKERFGRAIADMLYRSLTAEEGE